MATRHALVIFPSDLFFEKDENGFLESVVVAEQTKRMYAIDQAGFNGQGLLIHTYGYHTDYFIDYSLPIGLINEMYFNRR